MHRGKGSTSRTSYGIKLVQQMGNAIFYIINLQRKNINITHEIKHKSDFYFILVSSKNFSNVKLSQNGGIRVKI